MLNPDWEDEWLGYLVMAVIVIAFSIWAHFMGLNRLLLGAAALAGGLLLSAGLSAAGDKLEETNSDAAQALGKVLKGAGLSIGGVTGLAFIAVVGWTIMNGNYPSTDCLRFCD